MPGNSRVLHQWLGTFHHVFMGYMRWCFDFSTLLTLLVIMRGGTTFPFPNVTNTYFFAGAQGIDRSVTFNPSPQKPHTSPKQYLDHGRHGSASMPPRNHHRRVIGTVPWSNSGGRRYVMAPQRNICM